MPKAKSPVKPRPKTVKRLSYRQAMDYLQAKYKFRERGYGRKNDADRSGPYLDFWHWILATRPVQNGCDITFSKYDLSLAAEKHANDKSPDNSWRVKIVDYILAEFGKGRERVVTFWVAW